ncbi:hypothetical protein [Edaphobacter acidisoli]|uniref:hypothetical protein n=1 Tax=Edaphobacter acidisoli TaxID=2040573 RepID=UPI00166E1535|nr:hypothetical protein [Edaphobacter acidisoli]
MSTMVPHDGHETRKAEIERALGKVLAGHSFRSSAQCQALLRYIVEHSIANENELLRERMIGIKVFGRPSDYDSGNDPVVRARAAEIRKRLAQHYLHDEGAGDEIRIEVPPGSYRATFAARVPSRSPGLDRGTGLSEEPAADPANQAGILQESFDDHIDNRAATSSPTLDVGHTGVNEPQQGRGLRPVWVMIGLVIGAVGFFAGHLSTAHISTHQDLQEPQKRLLTSADPVASFWAPFLKEDSTPIIAYADTMFLIDGSGDLFRFRHGAADNRGVLVDSHLARQFASNPSLVARAGSLFYDNGYTGTGDLRAMAMLISQFAQMGATPIVKSSYDISTDDLERHNVILLGSSSENPAVAQIIPTGDFLFESVASTHDPWSDQIVNSRPRSGEQSKYATVHDPVTHGIEEDYALVTFQSGVTPEHQIAILGGIDTTGTEGAALLVTSTAGVEELSKALTQVNTVPQTGKGKAFQALVRVDVKKGYQVLDSHLVTIHAFGTTKPAVPTAP